MGSYALRCGLCRRGRVPTRSAQIQSRDCFGGRQTQALWLYVAGCSAVSLGHTRGPRPGWVLPARAAGASLLCWVTVIFSDGRGGRVARTESRVCPGRSGDAHAAHTHSVEQNGGPEPGGSPLPMTVGQRVTLA